MFLKRIVIQGFKSFPDKTVIDFEEPVTGIVGPNGCGKSNITDAIRWVFGEQSAKSLRGTGMSDMVFNGTDNRKSVNVAEVTLVVDNSSHLLDSPFEELEITRRYNAVDNSGEYLINNQNVRLKDIQELILDSGLGRESLSIVTQGNISAFADAKPEERRYFFEEAAGIAKYRKRRHESQLSLERTQLNLDRVSDIIGEIETQDESLRRQAKKAESYLSKKEELEKIEVAVLVYEIKEYQDIIDNNETRLREKEAGKLLGDAELKNLESDVQKYRDENYKLDFEIGGLRESYIRLTNNIQSLERQKAEADAKSRYLIQTGNDEEKIREYKRIMDEAKSSYDDWKKRYNDKQTELQLAASKLERLSSEMNAAGEDKARYQENERRLQNELAVNTRQRENPYQYQPGLQAIVNARNSLPGILDVVSEAIDVKEGYQEAISTALGAAVYHIITVDEASARNAISFLKRNRSGRATFLPLNVIEPRYIPRETEIIVENSAGYLGIASDFVDYDGKYENIVLNLLGNTLVAENLEKANEIAYRIKYSARIVTLEGDVVNRGGSMTGGKTRNNYSPLNLEAEANRIRDELDKNAGILDEKSNLFDKLSADYDSTNSDLIAKRLDLAKLDAFLANAKETYENALMDYKEVSPTDEEGNNYADTINDLVLKINESSASRNELNNTITLKNEKHRENAAEIKRLEDKITKLRQQMLDQQSADLQLTTDITRAKTLLEQSVGRLNSEYQLTLETALKMSFEINPEESRQRVLTLRQQLKNLGNVNLDAPAQYEEIHKRFVELKSQYDELVSSKEKLLSAIKEMDDKMESQFYETFKKINAALPEIFVKLFGGGKAKLFLSDPDDLLATGVDIDVQPPGKNVQNIRLFSGGEKTLIAICVLFAIIKVKPVPLCVFDEIDSALDSANVDRFADYLKSYSNVTQFLVVTHRTGTMERCDTLYGVTMPTRGVSQMLKVRLSEAAEMSEGENEE